jgi:hypothetical protein
MRNRLYTVVFGLYSLFFGLHLTAADSPPLSVDQVLQLYVQALGGKDALSRITTREIELSTRHEPKASVYWQAPNKALRITRHERLGFDGGSGWFETKKKKVKKLSRVDQDELQTQADPIRFVHLKDLYPNVEASPPASIDSRAMNVLTSPNAIGSTKFYFDAASHLLCRVEQFGSISAYYTYITDFSDYKEVDGIKLPHRITKTSNEPGAKDVESRVTRVEQNQKIDPVIFSRPNVVPVVTVGKTLILGNLPFRRRLLQLRARDRGRYASLHTKPHRLHAQALRPFARGPEMRLRPATP